MSSDKPKEPLYVDPFYEKRAERLKLLDNSAKACRLNRLSPSVEQLEEAIRIGYELLENLHQNNVKERLCDLMEKSIALVERLEAESEQR